MEKHLRHPRSGRVTGKWWSAASVASLASDNLHQCLDLECSVWWWLESQSWLPLPFLPELLLQLCSSTGLSCPFSLDCHYPQWLELLWVEDSWILPHFVLHDAVLPYLCRTFYDFRSTFIHVTPFNASGEPVWSELLFILQIRDMRLGVLRKLAQSHKAGRWWRHNSNLISIFFRLNYREGRQFLSLPLLFFHIVLITSCTHTAGGGRWFELMFIVIILAVLFYWIV